MMVVLCTTREMIYLQRLLVIKPNLWGPVSNLTVYITSMWTPRWRLDSFPLVGRWN